MDNKFKSGVRYEIFTILHIGPLLGKKKSHLDQVGIKVALICVASLSVHLFDFNTC